MQTIEAKKQLRASSRSIRQSIGDLRRYEAAREALVFLMPILRQQTHVLSYASFNDEFDTLELNRWLACEGKLLLPQMDGVHLKIFQVEDIERQLQVNRIGIAEPVPELCQKADSTLVSLALVPGLVYDADGHRLGYGKGCYDLFLKTLSPQAKAYGLGFKEQLLPGHIPVLPTDIALHGLFLF